jgi:hypothetical protein
MSRTGLLFRALTAALLLAAATSARADAARDALDEVAKCAAIADAAARLACYDAAAPKVKSALTAPPAQAQAQEKEKSFLEWFGFGKPKAPVTKPEEFGKPPPETKEPGELTQISATVVELAKTARGKALFLLDNGQVWRQLDADSTEVLFPDAGKTLKVTIEIGFLGSYNLTIEGRNGLIKVTRLK